MKKFIGLFVLLCVQLFFAQYKKLPKDAVNSPNSVVSATLPTTTRPDWIEIYENQNLTGRVAKYAQNVEHFTYPFSNKRNISLKIAPGYLAYITLDDEFKTTEIFQGEQGHFGARHLDILSIKVVGGNYSFVNFSGISTEIHNNDCKKFAGSILVKVVEQTTDGQFLYCPLIKENDTSWGSENNFRNSFLYRNNNVNNRYLLNDFVVNNNPVPEITTTATTRTEPRRGTQWLVSNTALAENRIFIEIEVDLRSAHKSGDLATDYSSNVKMAKKEVVRIPYQEQRTFFTVGPFQATGSPDNTAFASGGIFKNFRVHLNKLNPESH